MKKLVVLSLILGACTPFDKEVPNHAPVIWRVDAPADLSGPSLVKIYTSDSDSDNVAISISVLDDSLNVVADGFTMIPSDDGTGDDEIANDGIFTGRLDLAALEAQNETGFTIRVSVSDEKGRVGGMVSVRISTCAAGNPPILSNLVAPDTVNPTITTSFLITVTAFDPDTDIRAVFRKTPSGLILPLRDDGTNGDAVAGDGIYSETVSVSPPPPPGSYEFLFYARDCAGLTSNIISKTIVIIN